MSAAFVFLILFGMAAIIWSACFVGCALVLGIKSNSQLIFFSQYQGTILNTSGLVACWPLDDTSGTTAQDVGPNHFNGTYTTGAGTFVLNQPNIVAGDADTTGGGSSIPNPCVLFDGGFVNIPYQAALGPPTPMSSPVQFTIEAWVKPNWASSDLSTRVVVASASASPQNQDTGFALYAAPDSTGTVLVWAAGIGLGGTTEAVARFGNNQPIMPGSLYFLVVTYNGSNLTLWANPADNTQEVTNNMASGYVQVPLPIPFFIGMGRPDLTPPMYPFNGWIQDVAFYNVVLSIDTIQTHYMNGEGIGMM